MKKHKLFLYSFLILLLVSSCTNTFGGTVMVLNFMDVIYYVFIALIIAGLISFLHPDKRRKMFLTWFIVSIVVTPLPGLVYFLFKVTKKDEE